MFHENLVNLIIRPFSSLFCREVKKEDKPPANIPQVTVVKFAGHSPTYSFSWKRKNKPEQPPLPLFLRHIAIACFISSCIKCFTMCLLVSKTFTKDTVKLSQKQLSLIRIKQISEKNPTKIPTFKLIGKLRQIKSET